MGILPMSCYISAHGQDAHATGTRRHRCRASAWGIHPMAKRHSLSYFCGMKSSTTDKIEGAGQTAKGNVREAMGKLAGNQKMRDRGTVEKVAGKLQSKLGDVKKVFGK